MPALSKSPSPFKAGAFVFGREWRKAIAPTDMDQSDAIKIQLALFAIAATYEEIQNSPVALPENFAGNKDGGKRPMTKTELEALIDHRWQAKFERLEREMQSLKRRVDQLENKG